MKHRFKFANCADSEVFVIVDIQLLDQWRTVVENSVGKSCDFVGEVYASIDVLGVSPELETRSTLQARARTAHRFKHT